jgi:hypothetical protein
MDSQNILEPIKGSDQANIHDFLLSENGTALYLYQSQHGEGVAPKFTIKRWDIPQESLKLEGPVSIHNHRPSQCFTSEKTRRFRLVPLTRSLAPMTPCALLQDGDYVRLEHCIEPNLWDKSHIDRDKMSFLNEFWESLSQRGEDKVVVSRRLRPFKSKEPEHEHARQATVARPICNCGNKTTRKRTARNPRRRRNARPVPKYDPQMDFDDLPDSDLSCNSDGLESDVPMEDRMGSDSDSLSADSFSISDARGSSQSEASAEGEDLQSPTPNSESSNSMQSSDSSSNTLSSAAPSTADSVERLRTQDFLTSSENSLFYHEAIKQGNLKFCDICAARPHRWLHCFICHEGDFDICLKCRGNGQWCLDKSHALLEADATGPITMCSFSNWTVSHE